MRRKMAFFLAAAMVLQQGQIANAAEAGSGRAAGTGTGQVDISIASGLILKKQVDFKVSLEGNGTTLSDTITLGADSSRASFEYLAAGTYTLGLKADGFAKYEQKIEVGTQGLDVNLATGFLGGFTYSKEALHPGVLLIGDVNNDGTIDETDRKLLVDAIDQGSTAALMDLNGDGVVNLVDLEYFTKGYNVSGDTLASLETFVPVSVIAPKAGDNTKVEGDLNALLKNQASVKVQPEFGGNISKDNPVSLDFEIGTSGEAATVADGMVIETAGDNSVSNATISVTYVENGEDQVIEVPATAGVSYLLKSSSARAEFDKHGNIVLNLGGQVAVKRVTLTITGMKKESPLAEISKVEFVNGMENRIPEPQMDIPQNVVAVPGSELISLSWDPCVNVTGYEVSVKDSETGVEATVRVAGNSIQLTSLGEEGLENYKEYKIKVQSVNGTWRSGYGSEVSAIPKPTKKPDKPDNVSATGNYKSINVSWKKMKDTQTYNLYYKEKTAATYQKITGIEVPNYMILDLKDKVEYMVYVTGVNELGESGPSLIASAKTTDLNAPVIPRYHMINFGQPGQKGAHIISATKRAACPMVDSPLDTTDTTAWGTVDSTPTSYYQTAGWDEGGFNALGTAGLIYEFDQAYKMDTIAMYCLPGHGFTYYHVRYWDENGASHDLSGVQKLTKQDADGRSYTVLLFAQPVMVKKIQIGLGAYLASSPVMQVSEIYFYHYDTVMGDIMALYQDDLHTVLRPDVTQATIDALRARSKEIDEVSGEYNPNLEALERELQTAEDILHNASLNDSIEIHNGITMKESGRGFGGLNAWQPLGVTAAAGEKITIYVGSDTKKSGEMTSLRLVASQYHSESNAIASGVQTLKVGANVVDIPRIGSLAEQENGGALYIEYTGAAGAERYAVRVSGGVAVPRLDLYDVTDKAERQARAEQYVTALDSYVAAMEQNHNRFHKNSEHQYVQMDYDRTNCVLGATDILLNKMMFSIPAPQILAGLGTGTVQERAQKLVNSMDAMEDMMHLFYQHKGLNNNAPAQIDQIPKSHLNIRYQRMFAGAFMYAAGNHIGIEWGSTSGMVTSTPVQADAEGKYQSGRYFGWGIAHEIGHDINQGAYAVAEITNNYFAVLAQAKDTNDSVRFQYDNVYKKVTSGTKGKASNVFTQLAMYWQLHLAYDNGYNYKTYDDYNEHLKNIFFARVDTYARTPSKAPMPGKVALTISGGSDQALMRLACAAAEKNLLDFFDRWGMTPDADTIAYAGQFPEETRAIYYVNDEARVYRKQGGTSSLGTEGKVEAVGDMVTAAINAENANQVDFTLGSKGIPESDVLGYEIVRCMWAGSEKIRETVGFTTGNTFSDTIVSINNRMVWYEVTVIDKYLNRSAVKVLDPVKIQHDGSLDKTFWTVSTNNLVVAGETDETGSTSDVIYDKDPELDETAPARMKLVDHDISTIYEATAGENAEIVMEFNKLNTITGIKCTFGNSVPAGSYEVLARSAGSWVSVAKGSFEQGTTTQRIYFANDVWKHVGSADAVKLVLTGISGSTVSIAEIDVLGVTGDNIDFHQVAAYSLASVPVEPVSGGAISAASGAAIDATTFAAAREGAASIGKMAADYQYGTDPTDVIKAGSIVFTGTYKGNAAYNVVVLYDQDGNIVAGKGADGKGTSLHVIFADVPKTGNIEDTMDGIWVYWIEPDLQVDWSKITQVRAELYRVNDALTNEGERLVSDSLFEVMPPVDNTLPEITFDGIQQ